ncbi:Uncharacterised protein [Staphylococcus aureus]|nr:Uncharacterised protein [Staphylococcus aureus]
MMYQKQLIQIIKTLLNKKKLNLKMVLLHVKLMKKHLIIQLLTRNQVNNLKKQHLQINEMHQKHRQIKLQVRKSNIIRKHHKVQRNKVVQVTQRQRLIKKIQKQQMLNHPMHQKNQMLKLKKLKVK